MIKEISKRMTVWDSPVFVSHWVLAICFLGAILTQESEKYRLLHVTMGYTMLGIVAFRVIWGIVGSKYARFSTIKPRLLKAKENLLALLMGQQNVTSAINAVGFLAAYILMILVLFVAATGYLTFNEIGPELVSELHELIGNLLIGVVVAHVGSILLNSFYQYQMRVSSSTSARVQAAISKVRTHKWVAAILLVMIVYFWGIQFKVWL